jgi:hypothetical protein
MADTKLHPILAKRGITPGTPEAVLKVAEYFVQLKYEEKPNKSNIFGFWYGANNTHWCAQFVTYCFTKAGAGHVVQGAQQAKGFMSCTAGIKGFKKKGLKEIPVEEAQPGDIIFFDWDHDHDPDHVGIVVKNNPKRKTIVCREGNTSRTTGSRSNGGQVAERTRNYSNVFTVFRPNWKVTSPVVVAKKSEIKKIAAKPVVKVAAPVVRIAEPAVPKVAAPQPNPHLEAPKPKTGGMLPPVE